MIHKGLILVVDDTHENLKLMSEILAAENYQVRPADSGAIALASVSASPPELILLDIRMPDMDGFEVLRRLKDREESRDIPIIFLSAVTDVKQKVAGLKLGAVDFISKPFEREELLARVQTHLELFRLRTRLAQQTTALQEINNHLLVEMDERKRAEEQLRKAYMALRETAEKLLQADNLAAIGTIAAGVAHEILNPLNIIAVGIATMKTTQDLSAPVEEAFAIFQHQIDRVVRIILDLQRFSQKSETQMESANLRDVIDSTLTLCAPRLKAENIRPEVSFDDTIPTIIMDRNRMGQVFLNIINNALDAMSGKDKKELHIVTKLATDQGIHLRRVLVAISDQGHGIDAPTMDQLFDPFFTTKQPNKGTGLGLSISHTIVRNHGGRIWAENNPVGGATFFVELPVKVGQGQEKT